MHSPEDALLTFDLSMQLLRVPKQKPRLHSKHSDVLNSAGDSLQFFSMY